MNVEEQRQKAVKRARTAVYEIHCAIGYLKNVQPQLPYEVGQLQFMSLELVRIVAAMERRT